MNTPQPPKVCPKCGSRQGWFDPEYRPAQQVSWKFESGEMTVPVVEHLEFKCSLCRYPLRMPCVDAQAAP